MSDKKGPDRIEWTIRWSSLSVLLGSLVFVVVGDRVGPVIFERWGEISDMGFIALIAGVVSLVLGESVGLLRRSGG